MDQIAFASACLHDFDRAALLERGGRLINGVRVLVRLSILELRCIHITVHWVHARADLRGHDLPLPSRLYSLLAAPVP